MLNLTRRLVLGCAVAATLTVYLVLAGRSALAAAGLSTLAYFCAAMALAAAAATIYFVLQPLRATAHDARRIAEGRLDQQIAWTGHDDLGVIARELGHVATHLRELRDTQAGRRQMEYQLSDAVLQSIFEPVIVTDGRGQILKVNQAAKELLGDAAADRMALAKTQGGERILESIRDAVSLQKSVATEGESALLPMRIGEHERSYRLRATPMRDAEGRLLGAVTTLEDVTSLKDTDRFKTQFISVASRKLRDPLLRLRRGLYALNQGFGGELRPLQAELLTEAAAEGERLNDLMADLIEVAELDAGKRELQFVSLRPIDVLNEARNRHFDDASEKHVRIDVLAYADLSVVQVDRRAVRSIFDNLLTNALRYTPADHEILLTADEVGEFIQFTVRDTGRGIEADRLGTIFDRFNTYSEKSSGLGLALIRRLVESLGGQIAVESRIGQGTTFRISLPVAASVEKHHPVEVG